MGIVKSAARVMEVLELFARRREPLSGTEIGLELGYPKSSANALLKSLVSLGYLSQDTESLRYFPSLRVTRLGDWVPSMVLGATEAVDIVRTLHAETSETVTLSMQTGLQMQFIRVMPGTFPISLQINEGFTAPIFGTAVGAAMLSSLADDVIDELYDRARRLGALTRPDLALESVMTEVRTARRDGHAVGYDRILSDTGAVAAPLPPTEYGPTLVVGVGGLSGRIHRNEAKIIRAIKRAIARHAAGETRARDARTA